MLSFFRTNQILASISFLVYIFILRGSTFFLPSQVNLFGKSEGFFSNELLGMLENEGIWSFKIVEFGLLFLQAIYITVLVRKHQLVTDSLLIPGATYILIASAVPSFLGLTSILIANTFLLIAIDYLMGTYRVPNSSGKIFNVGFFIALASLFHFSYIIFLLLAIFGLNYLRAFRISEMLALLLGALVVYFLVSTYYFWQDELDIFWQEQIYNKVAFIDFVKISNNQYIELIIMGLLLLFILLSYSAIVKRQNALFQKKAGILYIIAAISLLSLVFQTNIITYHTGILIVPIGILLGLLFVNISKTASEVVHIVLLIIVLAWQFNPFWMA